MIFGCSGNYYIGNFKETIESISTNIYWNNFKDVKLYDPKKQLLLYSGILIFHYLELECPSTEFCGKVETHAYELYLSLEGIDKF
jgi:hypothetical protein